MNFTQQGNRITYCRNQRLHFNLSQIETQKMKGLLRKADVAHLVQLYQVQQGDVSNKTPSTVQEVVENHSKLFQPPITLPLSRDSDHHIVLLLRAKCETL